MSKVKEKIRHSCCRTYKLIFMDINMPVKDGVEATQEILRLMEEEKTSRDTRIVATTAAQSTEGAEKYLNLGFSEVCKTSNRITPYSVEADKQG